jgi:putative FmdB family regulatory protein
MPIYDYACANCSHKFEYIHEMNGVRQIICPVCGSKEVSKLVSIPGLIKTGAKQQGGQTCCGREERCEKPPCSADSHCRHSGMK